MNHALALVLAVGGFAGLALAMARHQDDLFGREAPPHLTRACRVTGWLLIVACVWLCVALWGWGLGLVIASGHTSAGAGLVFCALIAIDRRQQARAGAKPSSSSHHRKAA
ncbi:DUF3325 domain-containing protein [Achromobacter sp. GG226]|uniref:DUF3325 domain-containing protein n=1 Tax=Verticiella alkaliphila TaxID=2779529 RepID=UPI001C0C12E2|nr:DUF3325 domain-containing protein [Verticiella sp. GG226]MBU4612406.1 DUF3325 domain-containing protein [Verticiella sp. GG226]